MKTWPVVVSSILAAANGSTAYAKTYTVDPGGKDTNDGTRFAPFATIQAAANRVVAGDTVIIRRGRYPGFAVRARHGTASAPIIFRGEPGAIVDRMLGSADGFRNIGIVGGSYLTFEGLELTDSTPPVPRAPCVPSNVSVGYGARQAIKIDRNADGSLAHHLAFSRLHIHHVYSMGISGMANDSHIVDNHIHHTGSDQIASPGYGVYLKGHRWLLRGNRIHHNWGHGMRFANRAPGVSAELEVVTNSIIENNFIYSNGGTFSHPSGPTGCRAKTDGAGIVVWHGSGNTIRNNVIFDNLKIGVRIAEDFALNRIPNTVYNNTVFRNGGGGIVTTNKGAHTVVKNNIAYLNAGADDCGSDRDICRAAVASNNLVGVDPRFVSVGNLDFHLRADSPARDTGETIPSVAVDFDGFRRPGGARYDIGAFEYAAAVRGPNPPRNPSGLRIR